MGDALGTRGGSTYRDLIAWQKAVDLTTCVYRITRTWPREETYGLSSQTQRAAVSIPANIAEGHGLGSPRQFHHHLCIANGSLCELETHLIVARNLEFLAQPVLDDVLGKSAELGKIVFGRLRSLRTAH